MISLLENNKVGWIPPMQEKLKHEVNTTEIIEEISEYLCDLASEEALQQNPETYVRTRMHARAHRCTHIWTYTVCLISQNKAFCWLKEVMGKVSRNRAEDIINSPKLTGS